MEENESIQLNESSLIFSSILEEIKTAQFDSIQIICKGGKCINVSCLLLVSISPFLADLLKHAGTQDYVIILPDIEISIVLNLINNSVDINPEEKKVDKEIWSLDGIFWKKGYLSRQFQLPERDLDVKYFKNNDAISEHEEDHTTSYSDINDRFDSFANELDLKTEIIDSEVLTDLDFDGKNEPIVIKDCFVNIERISDETSENLRKRKSIQIFNPSNKIETTEEDPTFNPLASKKKKYYYPKKKKLNKKRELEKKNITSTSIGLRKEEIGKVFPIEDDNFEEDFNIKQDKLKTNLIDSTNLEDPRTTWFKIHELNPNLYYLTDFDRSPKMVCPMCSLHFPGSENLKHSGKLFFSHLRRHGLRDKECSCVLTQGIKHTDHIKLDHWSWLRCKHCEKIVEPMYINIHIFNRHVEDEKKSLGCSLCQKKFRRSYQYKAHIDQHIKKPTSCTICDVKYKGRSHKMHHDQVNHLKEVLGCSRRKCYFVCKTEELMKEHMKIRHNTPKSEKGFICDICAFISTTKSGLECHKLLKHDPDLVQCPMCPKMYNKYGLDQHLRRAHAKLTACTICGAKVKKLKLHMIQHLPYEQCKFKCEPCQKGFPDKIKLKAHMMNVHLKERPYNCRYGCEFGYNDVSNRNSHEKKKHGQLFTKEEPTEV